MAKGPICIRRTATIEEADIIVAWLEENGVKAEVVDRDNPGVLAFGFADIEGIAICVADEAEASKARTLLEEHDRQRAMEGKARGGPIVVRCEDCDGETEFAAEFAGSVQQCFHCGAHVDVPGGGRS